MAWIHPLNEDDEEEREDVAGDSEAGDLTGLAVARFKSILTIWSRRLLGGIRCWLLPPLLLPLL